MLSLVRRREEISLGSHLFDDAKNWREFILLIFSVFLSNLSRFSVDFIFPQVSKSSIKSIWNCKKYLQKQNFKNHKNGCNYGKGRQNTSIFFWWSFRLDWQQRAFNIFFWSRFCFDRGIISCRGHESNYGFQLWRDTALTLHSAVEVENSVVSRNLLLKNERSFFDKPSRANFSNILQIKYAPYFVSNFRGKKAFVEIPNSCP